MRKFKWIAARAPWLLGGDKRTFADGAGVENMVQAIDILILL
jgi:hypothetical protein